MIKTKVYWDDINKWVDDLVNSIKEKEIKYSCVYGIPRGGLVPAVMLSHKLDIPLVTTLTSGCLVVDEVADTGKELTKPMYYGYDTAVLVKRYSCPINPTYIGLVLKSNDWLMFPWEVYND